MQRICCRSRLRTTSEAASSRSAALRVRLVVFPWTFVPCTFLGAGERGGMWPILESLRRSRGLSVVNIPMIGELSVVIPSAPGHGPLRANCCAAIVPLP